MPSFMAWQSAWELTTASSIVDLGIVAYDQDLVHDNYLFEVFTINTFLLISYYLYTFAIAAKLLARSQRNPRTHSSIFLRLLPINLDILNMLSSLRLTRRHDENFSVGVSMMTSSIHYSCYYVSVLCSLSRYQAISIPQINPTWFCELGSLHCQQS